MWRLYISGPDENQRTVTIIPGQMWLGRRTDNDVVLVDSATSRRHAMIECRSDSDRPIIQDLNSANGTLVNRRRLSPHEPFPLAQGDRIQIGHHIMTVDCSDQVASVASSEIVGRPASARIQASDLLDPRTHLMYRVAHCVNTISDPQSALAQVSDLIKETLGAAHCTILLSHDRDQETVSGLAECVVDEAVRRQCGVVHPGFADECTSLPRQAPDKMSDRAILCVPVIRAGRSGAIIYLDRTDPTTELFTRADLELMEAVGHMVALTIEHLGLSERAIEEQKLRRLLHSYLPPARVDDLLQDYLRTGRLPGLAEQQATVLFADIADSTKMAERLGARLFGECLQRYYEDMTQIVSNHEGYLEKYLGDGVMAVFGLGDGDSRSEYSAVRAGLAMLDFVESHYDPQEDGIQIGVGVNSGPVVAGYVRTRGRVDFTILGDTVNVAHGLQSLARPNRLLIGPATCARIVGRLPIRDLGSTLLKGREEPLQVHEVLREVGCALPSISVEDRVCSELASPRLSAP